MPHPFASQRVMITGANGFMGGRLARAIRDLGGKRADGGAITDAVGLGEMPDGRRFA